MNQTKRCAKCLRVKPVSEFYKNRAAKDGLSSQCKACTGQAHKARYAKIVARNKGQPVLIKEKTCCHCLKTKPASEFNRDNQASDRLSSRCRQCQKKWTANWDTKNPGRRAELAAKWMSENPGRKAKTNARWVAENPERYREIKAKWRLENPERDRERKAKWAAENPERYRELRRNGVYRRRNLKRGIPGSHTLKEWTDLQAEFDHCCVCCGERKPLFRDHILPINPADKKPNGCTDYIANIQPLCQVCNNRKSNRHSVDYRQSKIGRMLKKRARVKLKARIQLATSAA